MGPFPHDAEPPLISPENPMGTDGFEFVEFSHPDPSTLDHLFKRWASAGGEAPVQGRDALPAGRDQPDRERAAGFVRCRFAAEHGPSAPAMAFRVVDAEHAFDRALSARREAGADFAGPKNWPFPAIEGTGGLHIYLVDRYGARDRSTTWISSGLGEKDAESGWHGLWYIDHLTHNVYRGRLNEVGRLLRELFNFRQIRYFDIAGRLTGLHSRAMTSPDGKIRIPINEDAGDKGQIEEYLKQYSGEGIQHIALGAMDSTARSSLLTRPASTSCAAPNDVYYSRIDSVCRATAKTSRAAARRHPHRRRRRRRRRLHQGAAAAVRQDGDRSDLLRIHPAQGRRRIRRRQLQGPVRVDRGRSDSRRRVERVRWRWRGRR